MGSLTMSQSQININVNASNESGEYKQESCFQSHSKSLDLISSDASSNYVHYLLMEQQKEIIKQEYESKLKEYKRAERQRSQSFHSEFYAESVSPKSKKKRKRKKKKKYYMNEQQIEDYYRLLQQEHLKRMQSKEIQ